MSLRRRLLQIYEESKVILFDENSKFVIMSDCHRGQGNSGDNFLPNQNLFFGALEYYFQNEFSYIELGDGDELWENRRIEPIIEVHSDAFWLMSQFYRENRFHMLSGNHDIVKQRKRFMKGSCESFYDECERCHQPLFPGIEVQEGIILEHKLNRERLFLIHGHQGDLLNDILWPISRFLVRYIWRPLELIGFLDPTGAARTHKNKDKVEKRLSCYANESRQILIAGHTHRPVLPSPGEGFYFNDGSCVHPRCITAIEIFENKIVLVKWSVRTREDRTLFVAREELEDAVKILDFYK